MDTRCHEPAPCGAWSAHAAELAQPWAAQLQRWPDTPTTARMVADGCLVQLLPGVQCPPDLLRSAVPRALLLGSAIGPRLRPDHVIGEESAAWVVLGGLPPERPVLHTPAHRSVVGGVRIRHVALEAHEVETIGGAPVTAPARTALDLLRFGDCADPLGVVGELLASGHLVERELLAAMDRFRGRPGSVLAEQRLRLLGALPRAA